MQPSTHPLQTSVPVPVNPAVRKAVGKNNIKPTTAKPSHAPATAPASSAVNSTVQAALVATVSVPESNKAHIEHAENDSMSKPSSTSSSSKKKVGAILRDWDWN